MKAKSLRPFIGAKDFEVSRNFYKDLGFEEVILFHNMSLFTKDGFAFYLQDAYVKDWIENTMLFLEVENVEECYQELLSLNFPDKYDDVRLSTIQHNDWGSECFVHDPSGILWHFGEFKNNNQ